MLSSTTRRLHSTAQRLHSNGAAVEYNGAAVVFNGASVALNRSAVEYNGAAVEFNRSAVAHNGTAVVFNGAAVECNGAAVECNGRAFDSDIYGNYAAGGVSAVKFDISDTNLMLEVQNININYGVCAVVRDVSFNLEAGKIIALLGANGAGKTTLLKSLNASLPIAAGAILLDGKDLNEYSRAEIARKIAVVAQETETRFPVSVLEFVLAGRFAHAAAFGWETETDLQIAFDCLRVCDLDKFDSRQMNKLSGGERQRAVLARALATEAKVFLLDEPTANLDLAHQALMFRLISERCVNFDNSAVLITHDLNLAAEFADQIILLKNGEIQAQGAPEKVLTEANLSEIFNVKVLLDENPASGKRRVTTIYK